jgi:hypothetical protein
MQDSPSRQKITNCFVPHLPARLRMGDGFDNDVVPMALPAPGNLALTDRTLSGAGNSG